MTQGDKHQTKNKNIKMLLLSAWQAEQSAGRQMELLLWKKKDWRYGLGSCEVSCSEQAALSNGWNCDSV